MSAKIYMTTDLEGASGITQESQSFGARHESARRHLTYDVNAAVVGAQDGGADHIVVSDGHGHNAGYNFLYEELAPGAMYQLGAPRTSYAEGIDETYAAGFAVAYHGMAGTKAAIMDHTQSSRAVVGVRRFAFGLSDINGPRGVICDRDLEQVSATRTFGGLAALVAWDPEALSAVIA